MPRDLRKSFKDLLRKSMETMGDETAVNPNLTASVNEGGDGGDVGENPSLGEIGVYTEGPTPLNLAMGPPSPLTGCYLLIVIGEPYSQEHKDVILQKLLKGKLIKRTFQNLFIQSRIVEKFFMLNNHKYHFVIVNRAIFFDDVSIFPRLTAA